MDVLVGFILWGKFSRIRTELSKHVSDEFSPSTHRDHTTRGGNVWRCMAQFCVQNISPDKDTRNSAQRGGVAFWSSARLSGSAAGHALRAAARPPRLRAQRKTTIASHARNAEEMQSAYPGVETPRQNNQLHRPQVPTWLSYDLRGPLKSQLG